MRKPVKKYFSPAFGCKSIMYIRKWLTSGASALDIARWINLEYSKASEDKEKHHLGMMLCAVMATENNVRALPIARKCADLFSLPLSHGRTVAESAMLNMMGEYNKSNLEWFESFNPYFVKSCKLPSAVVPANPVTSYLPPKYQSDLITVNAKKNVYIRRDNCGRLLLIVINKCNTDMLIDEEKFNFEPPLYFTESTHFVSPVWLVNQVSMILEYILMRIGYPPLPISKQIIFDAPGAFLINEEEYKDCEAWRGIEMLYSHKGNRSGAPAPSVPILSVDKGATNDEMELDTMLYLSIMATSEILSSFDIIENPDIDEDTIKHWCKMACIFAPEHYDFRFFEFDDE